MEPVASWELLIVKHPGLAVPKLEGAEDSRKTSSHCGTEDLAYYDSAAAIAQPE